jgi:hypothetical protein
MKVNTNLKAGQGIAIVVTVGAVNVGVVTQVNVVAGIVVASTIKQTVSATITEAASNSGAITGAAA